MRLKTAAVLLAGICLVFYGSESRADAKAAARILKSTVTVEWRADEPAEKKQAQADRQPAPNALAYGLVLTQPGSPDSQVVVDTNLILNSEVAILKDVKGIDGLIANYVAVGTEQDAGKVIAGSGVIVRADGLVLTSLAATDGGKFSVTLEDGRKLPAARMLVDQRSGLLLLKIEAKDLLAAELSLDPLEIGQDAIAGMCPDSRTRALRRGIITGKNVTVAGPCSELIPTDVAGWELISGAPLVNDAGKLIGVMTKQAEANAGGQSHAIPARFVKLLFDEFPAQNVAVVRKGFLGVQLSTDHLTKTNLIAKVLDDSPAAKVGLRANDELVKLDETGIQIPVDVVRAVSQHKGGDKIKVTYIRDGKEQTTDVTLSEFPEPLQNRVNVNFVQPSQIVVFARNDGKLVPTVVGTTDANPVPPKQAAGSPQTPVPSVTTQAEPAANVQYLSRVNTTYRTPGTALRVERSDLNQKLDELKGQVDALKTEVSKLTKVLEQLEKKLN